MSHQHVQHNTQPTLTQNVRHNSDIHGTKSVPVQTLTTLDARCNKTNIGTSKLTYLHLTHTQWSLITDVRRMTRNIIEHTRQRQRGRRPPSMQRQHEWRQCVQSAQSSLNNRDQRKHRWQTCEGYRNNWCTDTCRHARMDAVLLGTNEEFVSSSASLRLLAEHMSKQHSNLHVCSWPSLWLCCRVCFIRRSWYQNNLQ